MEVGRGEMVRRWRRIRAGRGEVHGRGVRVSRWRVCVPGWSVSVSERWGFIPRVLVPEWRSCVSWWESHGIVLLRQGVLGNMGGLIWSERNR